MCRSFEKANDISLVLPYRPLLITLAFIIPNMSNSDKISETLLCVSGFNIAFLQVVIYVLYTSPVNTLSDSFSIFVKSVYIIAFDCFGCVFTTSNILSVSTFSSAISTCFIDIISSPFLSAISPATRKRSNARLASPCS